MFSERQSKIWQVRDGKRAVTQCTQNVFGSAEAAAHAAEQLKRLYCKGFSKEQLQHIKRATE